MTLSERVKALMDARGEKPHTAAERLEVGYATLYGIVTGERPNPTLDVLEKIAQGYGITVASLLDQEGPQPWFLPVTAADVEELRAKLDDALRAVGRWSDREAGISSDEAARRVANTAQKIRRQAGPHGEKRGRKREGASLESDGPKSNRLGDKP